MGGLVLVGSSRYPGYGYQTTFSQQSPTTTNPYPYASTALPIGFSTPSSTTCTSTIQWLLSLLGPDGDEDEAKRWSSFIGIIVAISGNVLISLALNVQKYAHIRLRREKAQRKRVLRRRRKEQAWKRALAGIGGAGPPGPGGALRSRPIMMNGGIGDDGMGQLDGGDETPEDEDMNEHSGLVDGGGERDDHMYLHSPWWWLGLVLMTVGECGNFLAYGFAPASIVSPLGVVALISNCIIAPLMLKEPFRGRDFLGVVVSIAGAVIVVMSSAAEEVKLGPDEILEAISRTAFEVYFVVTCLMIGALMSVSQKYGSKFIVIDLGLVALFGGYTVLSTKGISSLLTTSLYHIFTMPIAYVFASVLVSTAIMQIKYVNRALQRFDSTQVIPTQFVLFTLSVIVGSGILYRDFEKIGQDRLNKFIAGCGFTFWGVYLITSGRARREDDEEDYIAEEGDIGLLDGEGLLEPTTSQHARQRGLTSSHGSAGSRRAGRPSFGRYQSSHSVAISDSSHLHLELPSSSSNTEITESSPLLSHHPDYHDDDDDDDSTPPSPAPERQSFSHSSTNLTTSTTTPQRHSISLVPGPIVLGYQLQAVVADHVGSPAAVRSVRRVKSRQKQQQQQQQVDMTLPPRTAAGGSSSFGEGSSRGVMRGLREVESASSGEDNEGGDRDRDRGGVVRHSYDGRGGVVGGSGSGSGSGNGKGSASARGRSSSLHLVMDYVNVGSGGAGSARRRNGSVGDMEGFREHE